MRSAILLHAVQASRLLTTATSATATCTARYYQSDSMGNDPSTSSRSNETFDKTLQVPFASFGSISGSVLDGTPQLCATPKKKLTLYRRGNRRVWYWLKRRHECAKCTFCGAVSERSSIFSGAAGNPLCTGQCVHPPSEAVKYPPEYRPPC